MSKKHNATDYEKLSKMNPDFMVICRLRTIINPEADHFLKFGMFAAHDSLLPKYRGFAPSNWTMINGEKLTGVTLFKITNGEIDSGKIYRQKEVEILDTDFAWDLCLKNNPIDH